MRLETCVKLVMGVLAACVLLAVVLLAVAAVVLYQVGKAAVVAMVEGIAVVGTLIAVTMAFLFIISVMTLVQTPPMAALGNLIAVGIGVWQTFGQG